MKLLRGAAVIAIGRKIYSEARRPENQARIKAAVAKARSRRTKRR